MKIGDKVRFTNNSGLYSAPTGSIARIVDIDSRYIQIKWIDNGDSSKVDGNYFPKYFEVIKEELETLPEKWCVEATKENWEVLFNWAHFTWEWNKNNKYVTSNKTHMEDLEEGNYREISFETFERLVLKGLPEKWAIRTTNETRKIINDFMRSKGYDGFWNHDYFAHYPFTEGGGSAFSHVRNGYTEISFETFKKLVLNKKTKTKKVMSKQKLTVGITDVLDIHRIACSGWKGQIAGYLSRVNSDQNITFTQEEVDAMFKAATKTQLPKLESIFGAQHKEPTLKDIANGIPLFTAPEEAREVAGAAMIEVRITREYKDKAFWLNHNYDWEIKKDSRGVLVLIPTPKN